VTRRGWVLFSVMCVVWGIPYLFIKVAVGGVSPPMVVFARTAGGAAVLLPIAALTGRSAAVQAVRRHWWPVLLFAVCEIIAPWLLLSDAERRLPSSLTGLLIAAVPITSVLVARLTGGTEQLSWVRWCGLVVGLAGVAVLALPHLEGGDAWAVVEVLLVALCYATGPLIAARKLAEVPSLPMIATCLTLAALLYVPAAVATWPQRAPSAQVIWALVGLATCCTALAFLVFLELIREVGTSRAMVFTYINPAVAVTAGVIVLGEPLTATIMAAFPLILAGSFLATIRQRQPQAQPFPAEPESEPGSGEPEPERQPAR
jgi:drug/metabolite transporter (DMT)-like permease